MGHCHKTTQQPRRNALCLCEVLQHSWHIILSTIFFVFLRKIIKNLLFHSKFGNKASFTLGLCNSVCKEEKAHTASLQGHHFPPIANPSLLQISELNYYVGKSIKRAQTTAGHILMCLFLQFVFIKSFVKKGIL